MTMLPAAERQARALAAALPGRHPLGHPASPGHHLMATPTKRRTRALTTAPSSERALDHPVGPTHPMVTTAERQTRVPTTGQLPLGPTG